MNQHMYSFVSIAKICIMTQEKSIITVLKTHSLLIFMVKQYLTMWTSRLLNHQNSLDFWTRKGWLGIKFTGKYGEDRYFCRALHARNTSLVMNSTNVLFIQNNLIFHFVLILECIHVVRIKSKDMTPLFKINSMDAHFETMR